MMWSTAAKRVMIELTGPFVQFKRLKYIELAAQCKEAGWAAPTQWGSGAVALWAARPSPGSPRSGNNSGKTAASNQGACSRGGESKPLVVVEEEGQWMGSDTPVGSDAESGRETSQEATSVISVDMLFSVLDLRLIFWNNLCCQSIHHSK